ncbi:MAG: nucleoside kinase [Clostridiales bacterium]|jgi:uridine kinase|nr:nucleoside kinase [Clostridiales bacterium]
MAEMIQVSLKDKCIEVEKGTTLLELFSCNMDTEEPLVVAAKVNNRMRELTYPLMEDCRVEPVDLSMKDGERIYSRSLVLVFLRACRELFPDCTVTVEHSFGGGIYCEVHGCVALSPLVVERIEERMRAIINMDEPIEKKEVSIEEANRIFRQMGLDDKVELMKYRREETISLYKCGNVIDYLYGYMVPSTGYLKKFGLKFYLPGVILQYPKHDDPTKVQPFQDNPKLFTVFRLAEKWSETLGIRNVADLNKCIEEGRGPDLIRISEAYQEKQIGAIADRIAQHADAVRIILIAGPSSSGKTTFAQRLRVQLMVNGLHPVPISMDNYYLDRDQIPLDENGEQDLESIKALDLKLFNEHMTQLIQGQEVEIPQYNFLTGKREYRGNMIKLSEDQPVIVEGIHGLNEKLTEMIPAENKYKIYISALTQLNVDDHNRIPTTDVRLIRRMVRDYHFRGAPIEETLAMWPFVRRGEEKNIFPFQESADIMFNSALLYELAVLKPYILPLLEEISEDHEFFPEVNRLKNFLKYFLTLESKYVPNNSILREFIGGSTFE